MSSKFLRSMLGVIALLLTTFSARAVVYTETGDAGQTIATAQPTALTVGNSGQPLTAIFGSLAGGLDVDIFKINILTPGTFSATTLNAITGAANLDTALYLFNFLGRPVYANDDDSGGLSLGSTLPAGNAKGPLAPGVYYIAISLSGNEPVNFANQLLFATSALSTDIRGPNPIATGPLVNFDSSAVASGSLGGLYEIDFTSAVSAIPDSLNTALCLAGSAFVLLALKRRKIAFSA